MGIYGVDFIPEAILDRLESSEKLNLILQSVARNQVVVMERALEPQEELDLIARTMQKADGDTFTGIKLFSLTSQVNNNRFLFGKSKTLNFSVIAPSGAVQVKDQNGVLSLRIPQ